MTSTRGKAPAIGLVVTLLSFYGLAVVSRGGWPGAASGCVAAGECGCEAVGTGLVAQPVNAATSLFFVLAGLALLAVRPAPALPRSRAMSLAGAIVGVGIASAAFHSALTEWAGRADLLAVTSIPLFAVMHRWWPEERGSFVATYLALIGVGAIGSVWVGPAGGRYVPLALGLVAVATEVGWVARRGGAIERRWLALAGGFVVLGAGMWWVGRDLHPWCEPDSGWQWHGGWHLLAAAALSALFMYWRSEQSVGRRYGSA